MSSMDEKFELKGYWWLPETPENEVSGTLSFLPGEAISLELMGTLNKLERGVLTQQDFINPSIIQGETLGGESITLEKCMQIGGTAGITGISTTRFSANFVYRGVHFVNHEQITFRGLSVGFHNLDEWFRKDPFTNEESKPGSLVLSYKQPAPIKTVVGNYHIDFNSVGPNVSMEGFARVNISHEAKINVWSETDKSVDDFLLLVRHLQNFLTLTMSKPTFVSEVIGNTELAKNENPRFYYPIKIYYLPNGWKPNSVRVQFFQMMLTLPDVEAQLEKILGNWISKAEVIKPVYDLYFSTLYNPSIYQELKFLSLVQAIETYHRQIYGGKYQPNDIFTDGLYKTLVDAIPEDIPPDFRSSLKQGKLRFANEYSLRKRIQILGEHIAEKLKVNFLSDKKPREFFIEKVADTRNYFTHYTPELKEKAAKSGQELHDLIQKLRLILQICFLEELGFTYNEIADAFKKNREYRDYFS